MQTDINTYIHTYIHHTYTHTNMQTEGHIHTYIHTYTIHVYTPTTYRTNIQKTDRQTYMQTCIFSYVYIDSHFSFRGVYLLFNFWIRLFLDKENPPLFEEQPLFDPNIFWRQLYIQKSYCACVRTKVCWFVLSMTTKIYTQTPPNPLTQHAKLFRMRTK